MSEGRETMSGSERRLHAYYDGELSGLARWRFERELRRSPELRESLSQLEELGGWIRERDAAGPAPDLWDAIALRLPAADAERAEGARAREERDRDDARHSSGSLGWWLKPVGAVATAAVVGLALYGAWGGLGPGKEPRPVGGQVVRWIDSGPRSVVVLDDDPDTTIIWVLDAATEGAWNGGRRDEA